MEFLTRRRKVGESICEDVQSFVGYLVKRLSFFTCHPDGGFIDVPRLILDWLAMDFVRDEVEAAAPTRSASDS